MRSTVNVMLVPLKTDVLQNAADIVGNMAIVTSCMKQKSKFAIAILTTPESFAKFTTHQEVRCFIIFSNHNPSTKIQLFRGKNMT